MTLAHPPLINASPGDPITSDNWNNIILAIKKLYAIQAQSTPQLCIDVVDADNNRKLNNAMITVVSDLFPPMSASYIAANIQKYFINHVIPAVYTLFVEVEGYKTVTQEITVSEDIQRADIYISMNKGVHQNKLPELFGLSIGTANEKIKHAGFHISRIIDSLGNECVLSDFEEDDKQIKVLNQIPQSNALLDIGGSVALLVSANVSTHL